MATNTETTSTTNARNPDVSEGIIQSLQKVWNDQEFVDFEVFVDGEIFKCHSVIIASCSEFFRGLLRSNMKEMRQRKVELNNISSTTFQLILKFLYTGSDLLTKENILSVWSAVHQLQIQFLIQHCENFVNKNLSIDNIEKYWDHAIYLQSENVKEYIFDFMLNKFEKLRKKAIGLLVRLDYEYLIRLLKSDQLKVKSEDSVLYSILEWVNYGNVMTKESYTIKACMSNEDVLLNTIHASDSIQSIKEPNRDNTHSNFNLYSVTEDYQADSENRKEPNERKDLLIHLLKTTRYYLASETCIENLHKDKLIQNDLLVKEMLFEACTFKFGNYWHGHWPTAALHRDCSDLEHFGVYCYDGRISALSLKENKWFFVPGIKCLKHSHLTVFKGKLYAFSIGTAENEIYFLNGDHWEEVVVWKCNIHLLVAHEQSIYEFDFTKNVFIKISIDTGSKLREMHGGDICHELQNPEFALSFHNNILVFCSVDNKGLEETAVHCWNTKNNEWTQSDNLEFSSKNMTSFKDDRDTYILDSNGKLLKLKNTEVIGFTLVARLWNVKYNLKGAVLFRKKLFLYGDSPNNDDSVTKVEGVFSSLKIWGANHKCSNFLHYVLEKWYLKPKS